MSLLMIAFLTYVIYITLVFVHTRTYSKNYLIFEKNLMRGSLILLAILTAGCFFGAGKALVLFFLIYGSNELIVYFFGRDLIWNKDSTTYLFYSLFDTHTEINTDLYNRSEACYDAENYTPEQAQKNKFKKIIELLELKPGHRLLDLGCGEGDLVKYCQDIGIEAAGVTLVKCQAERAKKRGLNVKCGSFHDFLKEFENHFDAVTFVGPLEHAAPHGHHPRSKKLVELAFNKIFMNAEGYLNPESKIRRIFTSTFHINPKYYRSFGSFVLSRTYGGAYPADIDGSCVHDYGSGTLIHVSDHTEDYYFATVNQPDHFGHTRNRNILKALMLFPIYPIILYVIIYDFFGYWMWHFDGHTHLKRDYTFRCDPKMRPATLYWSVKTYHL